MLAGDFYNEDGNRLGTDGNNDGLVYIVPDDKQAKQIKATDKAGGTTQVGTVTSALELPSYSVRQEIGVHAVARSNAPNASTCRRVRSDSVLTVSASKKCCSSAGL